MGDGAATEASTLRERADTARRQAAAHLPSTVARWLGELPHERHAEMTGSLLFADVSGFTALTERLADRGKVGAEDLTDILGSVMCELIDAAAGYGGDLLKYGGDALLLLFDGALHETRSVAAACEMQRRIARQRTSRAGRVRLGMSVGVASGPIDLLLVGQTHRELLVAGPTAALVVGLEHAASAGEIVVSDDTLRALARDSDLEAAPLAGGWRLDLDATGSLAASAGVSVLPARESPILSDDVALVGVPVALRGCAVTGSPAEHRQVAVGFIQVLDLPPVGAGTTAVHDLDAVVTAVQVACDAHGVAFLASDVDEGAAKVIVTAGAPTTSDGDVDRVLAVAHDVLAADLPLAVRVGVNAGRVFAVELGTDRRRFYTVLGDAVNLAARLMARADVGTVLASDDALASARQRYATASLPPFLVKGKELPVEASVVGEAQLAPHRPQATRLLGREREIDAVRAAVEAGRRDRAATLGLVGEPGTGKSAVLAAGLEDPGDLLVLQVQAGVYAAGTPYHALRPALRHALGVPADAGDEDVLESLLAAGGDELAPELPLVAAPFGVVLDDTATTAAIEARFRRPRAHALVTGVLAATLPANGVLVVDDAQWLDASSRDLLEHLLGAFADEPWAVIMAGRTAEDVAPLARRRRAEVLQLGPLGDDDALALVLGDDEDRLPSATAEAIVQRGGGNPMFLLDLAAAVRAGVPPDALPEGIERLVAARIDRLQPEQRELLRAASVLGARFDLRTLSGVLGRPVQDHEIEALGDFLRPSPHGYTFSSAVVRETAYEGLSFRRRRDLHGCAATVIEDGGTGVVGSAVELLALHHHRAEQWEDAWRWSVAAAERAAAAEAAVEAMRFFEQAVTAADHCPPPVDELGHVLRRLSLAAELAGRLGVADRALQRASRLTDDPVELASLHERRGRVRDLEGRYTTAERWYRRGLALLGGAPVGPDAVPVRLDLELGWAQALMRRGRLRRSETLLRQVAATADEQHHPARVARACTLLAGVLADLGEPEAVRWRDRALPIYERIGDLVGQVRALGNRAVDAYYDGEWDLAAELYGRAAALALRAGDVQNQVVLQCNQAEILTDRGDNEQARELLLDALATARATGYEAGQALAHGNLGHVLTRLEELDAAGTHLADARRRWERLGDPAMAVLLGLREAERRLLSGDVDRAGVLVAESRSEVASVEGMAWLSATIDRVDGLAAAYAGRWDDARTLLDRSRREAAGASTIDELWAAAALVDVLRRCDPLAAAALVPEVEALAGRLGVLKFPPVLALPVP